MLFPGLDWAWQGEARQLGDVSGGGVCELLVQCGSGVVAVSDCCCCCCCCCSSGRCCGSGYMQSATRVSIVSTIAAALQKHGHPGRPQLLVILRLKLERTLAGLSGWFHSHARCQPGASGSTAVGRSQCCARTRRCVSDGFRRLEFQQVVHQFVAASSSLVAVHYSKELRRQL
jgi:hypothetical protein